MTTLTSTAGVGGLLPDDYASLVIQPVSEESKALQVSVQQPTGSTEMHFPVLTNDVAAAFIAEGTSITAADATFEELTVTPSKVAGLSVISREMADDSSPAAQNVVGRSIARSIAKAVDEAYFGNLTAPAPAGLESLAGTTAVSAGGTSWTNLDPFVEAQGNGDALGADITSWVANPADALALRQLKESTGSNRPLLEPDPTRPGASRILGVPLYVSGAVTAGTVWGVPRAYSAAVVRDEVRIETSTEAYFNSDRVGVRATMRVGFGFPYEAAIQAISLDAA